METSTDSPASESPKPRRIEQLGDFRLVRTIGQGTMGTVFKSLQLSLDRIVALKVLLPSIARDEAFIARFQYEARTCAKLNHPNIVQGIDVGQDPDTGLWYFAMEHIDGPSLQQIIRKEKKIEERRALEITRDVAQALEFAARFGIIHRDIKPANILIGPSGEVKLADLGLVREVQKDGKEHELDSAEKGRAIGTPLYMAPEQIRGQLDKIDIRTDIYSLGASLFQMLAGQGPYPGKEGKDVMRRHLNDPVPDVRKVNPEITKETAKLLMKMLQKEREDRVQSPTELIASIKAILKLLNADKASATNMVIRTDRPSGTGIRPRTKERPSATQIQLRKSGAPEKPEPRELKRHGSSSVKLPIEQLEKAEETRLPAARRSRRLRTIRRRRFL